MKILLPKISIKRFIPSNYLNSYSYFAQTKEVKLFNYKKSYVKSNGVVFSGLRWREETIAGGKKSFYEKQKWLSKLYLKDKIKKVEGSVFVGHDSFSLMYYHWLCDLLVRIYLAKKHINKNFKIVIPTSYYNNNYCLSSLKMIGVSNEEIITVDKNEAIKSEEVFFISSIIGGGLSETTYDPLILELRETILDYMKSNHNLNFTLGKRIFISRSRQKKRIIINQNEVDELLLNYGFSSVNMEDFSFEQGISIIYNADIVVSQCGSNLTNIMFAKSGTKVLELYPKKEYGDISGGTWFSELSQACKLQHSYQYCSIDEKNMVINEFHTDMMVDIAELEKNLKLLIK